MIGTKFVYCVTISLFELLTATDSKSKDKKTATQRMMWCITNNLRIFYNIDY